MDFPNQVAASIGLKPGEKAAKAAATAKAELIFDAVDTNRDKSLDEKEFIAALKQVLFQNTQFHTRYTKPDIDTLYRRGLSTKP